MRKVSIVYIVCVYLLLFFLEHTVFFSVTAKFVCFIPVRHIYSFILQLFIVCIQCVRKTWDSCCRSAISSYGTKNENLRKWGRNRDGSLDYNSVPSRISLPKVPWPPPHIPFAWTLEVFVVGQRFLLYVNYLVASGYLPPPGGLSASLLDQSGYLHPTGEVFLAEMPGFPPGLPHPGACIAPLPSVPQASITLRLSS